MRCSIGLLSTASILPSCIAIAFLSLAVVVVADKYGVEPKASAPTHIQVIDHEGNELTHLSVYRYTVIPDIRTVCSETDVTWSISPELPPGLTYSYGVIKGEVTSRFPATVYNITATNSAGSASTRFTIEITDCPYGEFLFPNVMPRGRLYLKQGGDIVYYKELEYGDHGVICIPRRETLFEFTCTSTNGNPCTLVIKDESGFTYKSLYTPMKATETGRLDLVPTEIPIPSTPVNPVYLVSGVESTIFLTASTIRGNFTFSPALPETLHFDVDRSWIEGTWEEAGLHVLTVTCANAVGEGSFVLKVGVDACDEGLRLVHLVRKASMTETFNLTTSKGEVLYDHKFSSDPVNLNFCLPDDDYSLHLYQSDAVTSCVPLYVYDSQELIGIYEFPLTQGEKHVSISLQDVVKEGSVIRYHRGKIEDERWRMNSYDDHAWKEGVVDEWGTFDSSTTEIYFRKSIAFPDRPYGVVLVKLFVEGGVNVYVNGVHVFEEEEVVEKVWKRLTLPASLFNQENNVIAVLLQKKKATSSMTTMTTMTTIMERKNEEEVKIYFDLVCQPLIENHLLRSNEGTATEEQEHPDPTHPASHAFTDEDYWKISSVPASLTFTFAMDRAVAVNEIQFFKNGVLGITVRVEGILNNRTAVVLATPAPYHFLGIGMRTISFANVRAFSAYRLVIESDTPGSLFIKSTRFYVHNILTCAKQTGIEAHPAGSVVYQDCPLGQVGIRQFRCVEEANRAFWVDDRSGCVARHPEKGVAYIETVFRLWNVTMDEWNDGVVNVHATLIDLLTRNLTIRADEIQYTSVRDTSFDNTLQIEFNLLFTLEEEEGLFIKHHMDRFVDELDSILKKKYQSSCPFIHIETLRGPNVYLPFHGKRYIRDVIYVSIILILLIVICIIGRRRHADKRLLENAYSSSI